MKSNGTEKMMEIMGKRTFGERDMRFYSSRYKLKECTVISVPKYEEREETP